MPSIAANRDRWASYPWRRSGHEWSPVESPAGTRTLWLHTIRPRIDAFVPAGTILEIGPGFGRWTDFLKDLCTRLVVVDVTPRCIESCRERFANHPHLEYYVNDGASLDMIADGTVDFAFSFDSLVHAEADVVERYLHGLRRKLAPHGAAFIHHSNLGAYTDPATGAAPAALGRTHWRATTMSAAAFRRQCAAAGLECRSQEIVNWIGRGRDADRHHLEAAYLPLIDCVSVCRVADGVSRQTQVVVNHRFADEWRQVAWMSRLYGEDAPPLVEEPRPQATAVGGRPTLWRKTATGLRVARTEGVPSLARLALARGRKVTAAAAASLKAGLTARYARLRFASRAAGPLDSRTRCIRS